MAEGQTHESVLALRDVSRRFGGVRALRDVSFDVRRHEILGLLGPNGSGKSTCVNVLSGFLAPSGGSITWKGEEIQGKRVDAIVQRGIVRLFQQAMVFPGMTVSQHFEVRRVSTQRRDELLERLNLGAQLSTPATELAYGYQRLLGIALAISVEPELLLLDEPAAGLSTDEAAELATLLRGLRDEGLTILVIDHDMGFVLPLCDRVVVLDAGSVIFEGEPDAMTSDPEVAKRYLGEAA